VNRFSLLTVSWILANLNLHNYDFLRRALRFLEPNLARPLPNPFVPVLAGMIQPQKGTFGAAATPITVPLSSTIG
jgi:hypothetical protein